MQTGTQYEPQDVYFVTNLFQYALHTTIALIMVSFLTVVAGAVPAGEGGRPPQDGPQPAGPTTPGRPHAARSSQVPAPRPPVSHRRSTCSQHSRSHRIGTASQTAFTRRYCAPARYFTAIPKLESYKSTGLTSDATSRPCFPNCHSARFIGTILAYSAMSPPHIPLTQ